MNCLFLGGGGGVKKYDKDLGLLELHKNLLKTFQFFFDNSLVVEVKKE